MVVVVNMPKLSDTMDEGRIAEWLVEEGQFVDDGAPLVSLETDKATMEYASPEQGYLLKILVPTGGAAPLQAPIAVLGQSRDEAFDLATLVSPPAPTPVAVAIATDPTTAQRPGELSDAAATGRVRASPLARRVAEERGIDLATIRGSGPLGRVLRRDVETVLSPSDSGRAAPRQSARSETLRPLTAMRRTIARRLVESKNSAPHFYLEASFDMAATEAWRQQLNAPNDGAVRISVNDIIMFAAARALSRHPEVNCSWTDTGIVEYNYVDLAMAVALPAGLLTPVVRDAQRLGVRDLAAATKQLAARAKAGTLQPNEYVDPTFTISNLGMTRVEAFTAIVNPPAAAILAVGCPVSHLALDVTGKVQERKRCRLTLSCDHRAIDGMVGARFLETLLSYLESPLKMLEVS